MHDGRLHPPVDESLVFLASKSINGNDYRNTRAAAADFNVHIQRQLDQEKKNNMKNEITIAAMRARLDALEEAKPELRQIRREMGIGKWEMA